MTASSALRRHHLHLPAGRSPVLLRRVGAVVLAAHGAIHLLGVALLWRLAEPGTLRYEDVLPTAGPTLRALAGAAWLATTLLLFTAAALLVRGSRGWRRTAGVGAAASVSVLLPAAAVVPAGLAVDLAVFAVLAVLAVRARAAGQP